jgi:hypothetical protein
MSSTKLQRQKGSALVLLLTLITGIVLLVMGGMNAGLTQEYMLNRNQLQQQYLDEVAQAAQQWYERVAPTIELSAVAVSESDLLAQIAPTRKFGIRAQISPRWTKTVAPWTQPALAYRTILIWIPQGDGDTTAISTSSEAPVIGSSVEAAKTYRAWTTMGYQQKELAKLSDLLVRVGTLLQTWSKAQQVSRVGLEFDNFFRQADCSADANFSRLPCLDTYVDITTTSVPSYLGVSNSELMTPLGYAIEISNLLDSSTTSPPYSLSLRVHSPISSTDYLTSRIEMP